MEIRQKECLVSLALNEKERSQEAEREGEGGGGTILAVLLI